MARQIRVSFIIWIKLQEKCKHPQQNGYKHVVECKHKHVVECTCTDMVKSKADLEVLRCLQLVAFKDEWASAACKQTQVRLINYEGSVRQIFYRPVYLLWISWYRYGAFDSHVDGSMGVTKDGLILPRWLVFGHDGGGLQQLWTWNWHPTQCNT